MQGKEENRKSRKKENDEEQANKQIENCEKIRQKHASTASSIF